jgi:hypothetical protein
MLAWVMLEALRIPRSMKEAASRTTNLKRSVGKPMSG